MIKGTKYPRRMEKIDPEHCLGETIAEQGREQEGQEVGEEAGGQDQHHPKRRGWK